MKEGEKMLVYINRVSPDGISSAVPWTLTIDDKEMAMAVLNGLPSRFGTIITALDAIGDDDPSFTSIRFAVASYRKRRGPPFARALKTL